MKSCTFFGALVLVAGISACGTTAKLSQGTPLSGVGLGASKESILLSWSKDGQLSRILRDRTQVNILASYNTEFGLVSNEIISSNRVKAGFPGLKFGLPRKFKLAPSGPVCLRLAIGRKAIPLRIPKPTESIDGFHYSEWASNVSIFTKKAAIQYQLNTISRNINNFSKPDRNFETWRLENNLNSVNQCENLTSISVSDRPTTALARKARQPATRQQCVALYLKKFGSFPIFSDISEIVKSVEDNGTYLALAKGMKGDFTKYYPGKVYFPGSGLPIDSSSYGALLDGENISPVGGRLLLESYEACKLEADKRFKASYSNWKEVNSTKTIAARKKPLANMCRARFARDAQRIEKLGELQQVKSKIEKDLRQFKKEEDKVVVLPDKKLLVSHACPATS